MIPLNPEDKERKIEEVLNIAKPVSELQMKKRLLYNNRKYYDVELSPHRAGQCILCNRKNIKYQLLKYKICLNCSKWCVRWIMRTYGHMRTNAYNAAIAAFKEEVVCKFCGTAFSRVAADGSILKRSICSTCFRVWIDGYKKGRIAVKRGDYDSITQA